MTGNASSEVWKAATFQGNTYLGYEVSNFGNVRSFWKKLNLGGKIGCIRVLIAESHLLKKTIDDKGYCCLRINRNGKWTTVDISWLVLEAFVGQRPAGHEACHGPRGQQCDELSNLQWGTPAENQADRVRDGTSNRGHRQWQAKLTEQAVLVIKQRLKNGEGVVKIANQHGVNHKTISDIKSGKNWRWLDAARLQTNGNTI
jgi:NUMOD4 motif/HNH endonuclease